MPPNDPQDADPQNGPAGLQNVRLGRYRLFRELACGGMASVHLARAEGPGGFGKLVAIKRTHPHLAHNEQFIKMFMDEARIAAQISHPNVGAVFDFAEADGSHFLAMEYLHGETLGRMIRALADAPPERLERLPQLAARIVADACDGLHAAHELRGPGGKLLGVVHRDVTPSNVFVTYDGATKIVDFGIARAEGRLHQTTTPALRGKLGYFAPELLGGQEPDRRTDVFGIAVCLWELLALRRLFTKETERDTLAAILGGPLLVPSAVRGGIPPVLDAIVMRGLERDPDKRYATAREVSRELNGYLAEQTGSPAMADVADWMAAIFAEEKASKDRIVAEVQAATPASLRPPPGEADVSRVRAVQAIEGTATTLPATPSAFLSQPGRWPRGRWAAVAVGSVVVALAAGAVAWQTGVPGSPPMDPTGLASQTAAPADDHSAVRPAIAPGVEPEPPRVPVSHTVPAAAPSPDQEIPSVAEPAAVSAPLPLSGDAPPRAPRAERFPADPLPPPVRPAQPAEGVVSIATPPGWADVYWRGRRIGRAPGRVTLAVGNQVLKLRPYGELPEIDVRVLVEQGSEQRVVQSLDR